MIEGGGGFEEGDRPPLKTRKIKSDFDKISKTHTVKLVVIINIFTNITHSRIIIQKWCCGL